MNIVKLGVLAFAVAVPVAGAHAISFSNIFIDGNPASGSPFGPSGITFAIPDHFVVGLGSKSLVINYRVDATPGYLLSSFDMFPVGNSRLGSVDIAVDHINGGTESHLYSVSTGSTLISLPSQTNIALSGTKSFYDVRTVIDLTGLTTNSVNTVSLYSVSYAEAVPEPASMAALALGFGALVSRRRKGNNR
jgi:hypothetical protein